MNPIRLMTISLVITSLSIGIMACNNNSFVNYEFVVPAKFHGPICVLGGVSEGGVHSGTTITMPVSLDGFVRVGSLPILPHYKTTCVMQGRGRVNILRDHGLAVVNGGQLYWFLYVGSDAESQEFFDGLPGFPMTDEEAVAIIREWRGVSEASKVAGTATENGPPF